MRRIGAFVTCFLFLAETMSAADAGSMKLVGAIHQRYYLIKRLEGPMKVFFKAYEVALARGMHGTPHIIADFEDPTVRLCVQKVNEGNTIAPFCIVWEQFVSYKFIDKGEFARDTIALIYALYKDLMADFMGVGKIAVQNQSEFPKLLVNYHAVEDIDPVMSAYSIYDGFIAIASLVESTSTCDFIINNNIRFFHIKRLLRPMYILSRHQHTIKQFGPICTQFNHARIRECALLLEGTNSIKPLFRLWKNFVSYDFIEDDTLLEEFIRLIICIYCHIEIEYEGQKIPFLPAMLAQAQGRKSSDIETILYIYQAIHALPILALLDLLDDIVDQFDDFSTQYELHNKELSWREWLSQYWWSAPVMLSKFILILLRHAKDLGLATRVGSLHSNLDCGNLSW